LPSKRVATADVEATLRELSRCAWFWRTFSLRDGKETRFAVRRLKYAAVIGEEHRFTLASARPAGARSVDLRRANPVETLAEVGRGYATG